MLEKTPNFNEIAKQLIIDAKTIAEVEMINFIMGNFEKQGFLDSSLQPWQETVAARLIGQCALQCRPAGYRATAQTLSSRHRSRTAKILLPRLAQT